MTIKPDLSITVPTELGAVHFVGIGGSGMSGIARLFLGAGYTVSGSDVRDSANIAALRELGATITVGHDAANVGDADTLIVTGALWQDNPEYVLALERGLPVLHRSQALAWLVQNHRLIAVAGAHGKTTSTGMIVTALRDLDVDPTFVNGGVIAQLGVSSGSGRDDLFVIEADESDGTFLLYDTSIALITNVDPDHLDHWGTRDAFYAAFARFANEAREAVVISSDDAGARLVAAQLTHPHVVTFGEAEDATVRVSDIVTEGPVSFRISHAGASVAAQLPIPGAHNAINAAGAVAVLLTLGHELEPAVRAVEGFAGTVRRFELHGVERGVSVFDDYAHHPTEVAAALAAARTVVGDGRIIAIQQPHTYSRTQEMYREFAEVLEHYADHTVMLDVYGAREDPVPGVTGELVSDAFADPSHVHFVPDWQEAADYTASVARDGDYVITLGCGNVNLIIPQVLESLARPGSGATGPEPTSTPE